MEASALGPARRGRRRTRAAGSLLSRAAILLFISAFLVRVPSSVGHLVRLPRGFRLTKDSVKIVGSTHFPVKVYVMLHQKSPHVLCVTQRLRNAELIDPSFQWHGPKGKIVSAYREPHYYYQFTARYHAAPCNSIYNISFEKKLIQILSKLLLDLSCEISLLKSECHHVKMQRAGLQNELFFTFSVSSLDTEKGPKPCTDHNCEPSKRLFKVGMKNWASSRQLHCAVPLEAKNLIERFFNQQVEILGRRAEQLPEIYYIEGTLQMVWINRCFPGYGMNVQQHPKCPECCVICSPGSYNPRDGIHCLQCNSSLVYGAKTCL
ncbi:zona pellucida-binding protein 1 isoform X5 [Macaca thibetana thibetana]|nr:zona pellucida-binding protein 1 isoform X7 [Macaca fascicularis]XP_050641518.1 zona pellucida-binding protein 1 isoform X5 [Macaca thibetana thibetana]